MLECNGILENYSTDYKNSWEQTRMICYINTNIQSTKHIDKTDLMPFNWDNENKNKYISNESIERLRTIGKELEKTM